MHIKHWKQCLAHRKHSLSVSYEDNVHFLLKGRILRTQWGHITFVLEIIPAWCLWGFPVSFFQKDHWLRLLLDFLATRSILRFSMEVCAWNCRKKTHQRENNMSDTVRNLDNALIPSIHITVLWNRHFLSPQFCIEWLHHCCYIK